MPSIWDQYGQARPMAAVRKRQAVRTSVQRPVQNENSYPDYLMHYGILGQKWGIRRFQNEDGSYTAEGKERYGVQGKSARITGAGEEKQPSKLAQMIKANMEASARQADKNVTTAMTDRTYLSDVNREETKKGGHSTATRKAVMYAVTTIINPINAAYAAADGAMAAVANHNTKRYFKNREQNSEFDEATGLYKKREGQYTEKQDLAAVNPGYRNLNDNTKSNCMLCTATYDMRKRGYDVTAQLDTVGYVFGDLKRWYPKAKYEKSTRVAEDNSVIPHKEYVQNTLNKLTSQGNGARGNLMVWFSSANGGGGHSIIYEINNGSVVIKDSQTGRTYKNPKEILNMTDGCAFVRLDNVQPNLKKIKEECVR